MFGLESIGVDSITDLAVLLGILGVFVYYLGKFASSSSFDAHGKDASYFIGFSYVWFVALVLATVLALLSSAGLTLAVGRIIWVYLILFIVWISTFLLFKYMVRCKDSGEVPTVPPMMMRILSVIVSVILSVCIILTFEGEYGFYQKIFIMLFSFPLFFVLATVYGYGAWKATFVFVHLPKGAIQGQLIRVDDKETVILKHGKVQRIRNDHILRIEYL